MGTREGMVERLVTLAGVAAGRLCYPCSFLGMAMCDAPAGRLLYRLGALIRMRRRWFRVTTKLSFRVRTILSLCIPSTAELPTHRSSFAGYLLGSVFVGAPHASQALGRDSGWGVGSPSLAEQSRSHVVRRPSSNNPRAALTRPPASRLAFAGPGRSCWASTPGALNPCGQRTSRTRSRGGP